MRRLLLLLLAGLLAAPKAAAQDTNWKAYEDLAVAQLARYLQIDTTNPPGNEMRAARFFQEWFAAEGIAVDVYEFAPGRANLVARLQGDRSRRPLILLNHMDVVSSDPARWRVSPFSGAIVDGDLYGRGALDMKGLGLTQAMVLVMLKREGAPLRRDVIFIATSDEEVAMKGAEWIAENKRELVDGAEYLLTEGGSNLVENGRLRYIGVDTAEKVPFWLRLRARGAPGHGSRPIADAAPHRLVRALARVVNWETPVRVLPGVEKFFRDIADQEPPRGRRSFVGCRRRCASRLLWLRSRATLS